jgi:hypothetical protein
MVIHNNKVYYTVPKIYIVLGILICLSVALHVDGCVFLPTVFCYYHYSYLLRQRQFLYDLALLSKCDIYC